MNDIFILPLVNSTNVCIVDAGMSCTLLYHTWYENNKGYIYRRCPTFTGEKKIFLHTEVINKSFVDHKNRNPLDNRTCNLRSSNCTLNNANRKKSDGTSSKYKGVYWHKQTSRWSANIAFKKKRYFLGLFTNEKEAAITYNIKASELFGNHALLNKVD